VSIERVERKDGSVVWRVRWRQGSRNRSKVLGRKRDAEAFDAELRRRKRTGELAQLDAGREPLREFGEEWWSLHAQPNLARSTLELYAMLWDTHILPRLGDVPLRELTPEVVNRFGVPPFRRTGLGFRVLGVDDLCLCGCEPRSGEADPVLAECWSRSPGARASRASSAGGCGCRRLRCTRRPRR
jgi:hypothetical protein